MVRIFVADITYSEYRDDPIFPAPYLSSSHDSFYVNNGTSGGTIVCFDDKFICDSGQESCRDFMIAATHLYPWKDSKTKVTEDDLTLALLSRALAGSSTCGGKYIFPLEIESLCDRHVCSRLPPAQWQTEARRWFEGSLAFMQQVVFDTARGRYDAFPASESAPPNYRGMCHMVKFRSVGWQNVSFWGFFGLLALAAGISLASVRNEEGELWLCVGVRSFYRALRWSATQVKNILWLKMWVYMSQVQVTRFFRNIIPIQFRRRR